MPVEPYIKRIHWLLICLLGNWTAHAQDTGIHHLTDEDGLPSMTVFHSLQDINGHIWMGTKNGLCVYDGRQFERIRIPGFIDEEIIYLKEDRWGRIWVSNLSGQIGIVKNRRGQLFEHPCLPAESYPHSFCITDRDVTLSCVNPSIDSSRTHKKIIRLTFTEEGEFDQVLSVKGNLQRHNIHLSYHDGQWVELSVAGDGQRWKIDAIIDDQIQSSYTSHDLHPIRQENTRMRLIKIDDQGRYYLHGSSTGLVRWGKEEQLLIPISPDAYVNQVHIKDGQIYVASSQGIHILDSHSFELKRHLFQKENCYHINFDQRGNLWVSLAVNGVYVIPQIDLRVFDKKGQWLPNNGVYSLHFSQDQQQLFAGLDDGQFVQVDLQQEPPNFQSHSLPLRRILNLQAEKNGQIWAGGDEGICLVDPTGRCRILPLPSSAVKVLWPTKGDSILIGTSDRTSIMYPSKDGLGDSLSQSKPQKKLLTQKRTYGLCQEGSRIWIGTLAGIYFYQSDSLHPFLENGLHRLYRVSVILPAPQGGVWVGTHNDGLLRIADNRIVERYTSEGKLISNRCLSLHIRDNQLYIGTDKGLQILDDAEGFVGHINKFQGLPTDEINAIAVSDRCIWLGTPRGLIQLPKEIIHQWDNEVPLHLTGVSINGRDTCLKTHYQLAYDQNNLDISFESLLYRARGRETYRYRLLGNDNRWLQTDARTVRYHKLASGQYRFELEAIGTDGRVYNGRRQITFDIALPWWETLWFYLLVSSSLIGISSGTMYWRWREVRKRDTQELKWQRQIQKLRSEALRTQMNPHFIFNSLNAIQDYFLAGKLEPSLLYLSNFSHLIRLIFDYSNRESISLEEELEFLQLYLDLEKLRFGNRMESIELEVAPELAEQADLIQLPPLIVQPIAENAFKHGLLHKKGGGRLHIYFSSLSGQQIQCTITDNGIGRQEAKRLDRYRHLSRQSGGLKATRERLALLGHQGEKKLVPKLVIYDLKDTKGKALGTRVTLFI
ncbi:MAG: histidine kinase [Bacteroidota bacterium]